MRLIWTTAIVFCAILFVVLLIRTLDLTSVIYRAAALQRDFQNAMATSLRAIRAGDSAAMIALCGLTFGYGFVHALGPGHGKLVLGAAALSNGATLRRMALLTLASSLGQSLMAIILVLGGIRLFMLTSAPLIDATERLLAPVSFAAMGLIGCVLAWRGGRRLWRALSQSEYDQNTCAEHGAHPCSCGHRHAPSLQEVDGLSTWREMAALVISVAIRPCTGALFLLVIAWRLQILPVGIAATFTMGLGTATFNLLVAGTGSGARLLLAMVGTYGSRAALLPPIAQLTAGFLVVAASFAALLTQI